MNPHLGCACVRVKVKEMETFSPARRRLHALPEGEIEVKDHYNFYYVLSYSIYLYKNKLIYKTFHNVDILP